jgi:4-hydroxy-4-methyl-2-oxoglutarate aldolase
MRPIFAGAEIAGNAVTVLTHPGDNWMIHVAVEQCQPGDLLVVGVTADCTDGMFGELLATSVTARGVCGLVIDAGCRDVAALAGMRFPVWSRAVSAQGTVKATLGNVNLPVICAGAVVCAGDAVVADDDGVVVVPHADIEKVLEAAKKRISKEEVKRRRLAAGELGLDIENMRPGLAALGLQYFETIEESGR